MKIKFDRRYVNILSIFAGVVVLFGISGISAYQGAVAPVNNLHLN